MERRVKAARQRDTSPMDATFQITDTNLNVLVVTLSTENGKTFRTIKNRILKTIKWNKYKPEMTNQTKNNNLNYLIDPTSSQQIVCLII